jgi:hypothetical protein
VVRDAATEADVWWASSSKGSPNFEMDERWVIHTTAAVVSQTSDRFSSMLTL